MEKSKNINLIDKRNRLNQGIAYLKGIQAIKTQRDISNTKIISESSLTRALKPDEKYLTDNFLRKFANEFNFNDSWLLEGEGSMLREDEGDNRGVKQEQGNRIKNELEPIPEDNYMMVEFEDLEVSAGLLGGGEVAVLPERKTRLVPREYKKGYYLVVRVSGHSMDDGTSRSILEGDELLIKQYEENDFYIPIRTKLFVIVTHEGAVVKQIKNIDRDKKQILCHSFNPKYEDYIVNFDEILQIFFVEKKVNSKIVF